MNKERIVTTYPRFDADALGSTYAYVELFNQLNEAKYTLLLHGGDLGEIQSDAVYALTQAMLTLIFAIGKPIPIEGTNNVQYTSETLNPSTQTEQYSIVNACPVISPNHEIVIFDGMKAPTGIPDVQVVALHDHHPLNTGKERIKFPNLPENGVFQEKVGAIATYVVEQYREKNIQPSKKAAILLLYGILSNTEGLLGGTTTDRDRNAVAYLQEFAEIPDTNAAYEAMIEHTSSLITKETIAATIRRDAPVQDISGVGKVIISQILGRNLKERLFDDKDIQRKIRKTLEMLKKEKHADVVMLSYVEARKDKDDGHTYVVTTGGGEKILSRLGAIKQENYFVFYPSLQRKVLKKNMAEAFNSARDLPWSLRIINSIKRKFKF